MNSEFRYEHDMMGEVKVESSKIWGAQTQRSLENFAIGWERMPEEIIRSLVYIKKAAAITNLETKRLGDKEANAIIHACDEALSGEWNDQFPLAVWQTGSGTQTNMNVNEVLTFLANDYLDEKIINPNDHVNMGQSSNDTFPSAMHIAAVTLIEKELLPQIDLLIESFKSLSEEHKELYKIGRTHLQDATPITFGQEVSGWFAMLAAASDYIKTSIEPLRKLALGGTATGTGLNTLSLFGSRCAELISSFTESDFRVEENKFHALSSKDGLVYCHGALKSLAANVMKIANDIRWMASGPRCGLGEISIPQNEPGSSIMPGKVNPTQCEAVTMAAVQVMGNDAAIGFAASQGNFELNVFMPVIAYNFLQSVVLLKDVIHSFRVNCVVGIKPNQEKMTENLEKSLMLVTALTPFLGYKKSAEIAGKAFNEGVTLKEAGMDLNYVTESEFDKWIDPKKMVCNLDS